jgi:hypothetical protein
MKTANKITHFNHNYKPAWIAVHRVIRSGFGLLLGAALLSAAVGSLPALAQFQGPTPLTLINGWTNAPFGTSNATVEEVSGIVQFRGAIATSGTNAEAFVLPPSLSPATNVYIPVDLCNAANGRLIIQPSGEVTVEAENTFSDAQCFTSLDGASFALTTSGFTALTLINGWTNAPFGTSNAEVQLVNGAVHFKGAIATTGTNAEPFVLPKAFRPLDAVYIPVDLCGATNGRLDILPTGVVTVEAEGSVFGNAQCFTSLDGAWFFPKPAGFKLLTLINGWTDTSFGTSKPEAENAYGIVYFKGAIATTGTNATPFTLAPAFRPVTNVYVPVDLCDATKGRLLIQTNGVVIVQAETDFSNAQCFTSLDGASFVQ